MRSFAALMGHFPYSDCSQSVMSRLGALHVIIGWIFFTRATREQLVKKAVVWTYIGLHKNDRKASTKLRYPTKQPDQGIVHY